MSEEHGHAPEQNAYLLSSHWCITPFHKYVEQAVARVAPFVEGRIVLEMGCGDEFVTALLARHAQRLDAFDINERAIAFARMIVVEPQMSFDVGPALVCVGTA